MEEQKQPARTHSMTNEPGRRYAARRIGTRASTDILSRAVDRPTKSTEPTQPIAKQTPTPAQSKYLDFAPHAAKVKKQREVTAAKPARPRQNRSLVLRRHIVERAVEHRKESRRTHKRHFAGLIGGVVVVAAFLIVSWAFWDLLPHLRSISFSSKSGVHSTPAFERPSGTDTSKLDESVPTAADIAGFKAAADSPRILRIPKLSVEARVKRVGSSLTGEPISPSNIFDVGWFDDSGKPGLAGSILINGHVSGSSKAGAFKDIAQLVPNDELFIERGDGVTFKYRIVRVQTFTGGQLDMNMALQSIQADKNGLNIITSAANYDGGSSRADKRVIVFAVQQ